MPTRALRTRCRLALALEELLLMMVSKSECNQGIEKPQSRTGLGSGRRPRQRFLFPFPSPSFPSPVPSLHQPVAFLDRLLSLRPLLLPHDLRISDHDVLFPHPRCSRCRLCYALCCQRARLRPFSRSWRQELYRMASIHRPVSTRAGGLLVCERQVQLHDAVTNRPFPSGL